METLILRFERMGRKGKPVTVVAGFTRSARELEEFASRFKKTFATGGTIRGQSIELQGDHRIRLRPYLAEMGFTVKG